MTRSSPPIPPSPAPSSAMVQPFPPAPPPVQDALDTLARLQDRYGVRGRSAVDAPLPWDPATCDVTLRREVWQWCDLVVRWINTEHGWQTDTLIPACWPRHPHLANELPILACQRALAATTVTPDAYDAWVRVHLPEFLNRLKARLGAQACRPGIHTPWPAEPRVTAADEPLNVRARRRSIDLDTGFITVLRPSERPSAS